MRTSRDMTVAGLRPAVEPGILPGGSSCGSRARFRGQRRHSERQDAVLYGRRGACRHSRGFTLVEIIAVMAVMAALAAAVTPTIIRRVDRAAWTRETADLKTIADAYTQYILRSNSIPSYTNSATIPNWASAVASQLSMPVSVITTNSRGYARAFLIDPNLSINGAGLPYPQTSNGATNPSSARVMIVSSLTRSLPVSVTNSVASATNFTAIWNAAENTVPAGPAFSGWAGTGEDLRIKKLNLVPLFYQLILVDHNNATNNRPQFSINNSSASAVPAGALGLNRYYLDGTVVGLYDSNTNLQSRHLLKRNISFLFESDTWGLQIQGDQQSFSTSGADFFNHALTFFTRPVNPYAVSSGNGGSQYGVMIAMYTFMFDYTFWANECPHFPYYGNNANSVPEYVMLDRQGQSSSGNIDMFSTELIAHP